MRLLILGPPGAGKGTQAAILGGLLGIPHVSSGAELRRLIEHPTPLGREVCRHMTNGELVPDEIVVAALRARLDAVDASRRGYVLDGFPRDFEQVRLLDLLDPPRRIDAVIDLVASDCVITDRLLRRQRTDDVTTAVARRLEEHRRRGSRILVELARSAPVVHVDAEQEIADVTASILRGLASQLGLPQSVL